MCTVTYLPLEKGYILTSNRDESPLRNATPPEVKTIGNRSVYFPKDPLAGGTWFATDQYKFTLVLLNGGLVKHHHKPPYRRSRGLMVLDFFEVYNIQKFVDEYDFTGIEPFTLVIASEELHELIWTGKDLLLNEFGTTEPRIWSSSTLYPEPVRAERKSWFNKWLQSHKNFNQSEILEFHKTGGKGDAWNDFIMNRDGIVQTISVTSILKNGMGFKQLFHEDLLNKKGA